MAVRRGLSAGVNAANDTISMYIKDRMDRARQMDLLRAQQEEARRTRLIELSKDWDKRDPGMQAQLKQEFGVPFAVSSQQDVAGGVTGDIAKADSLSKLPSEQEALAAFQSKGGDAGFQPAEGPTQDGTPYAQRPAAAQGMLDARSGRQAQLEEQQPRSLITSMQPSGEKVGSMMTLPEQAKAGSFTVENSPAQTQANSWANSQQPGGANNAQTQAAEIAKTNNITRGTMGTAAQAAGMKTNAEESGKMTQDLMDKRVGEASSKTWDAAAATAAYRADPQANVTRNANLKTLAVASKKALDLENQGARIRFGTQNAVTQPSGATDRLNTAMRGMFFSPGDKEYTQNAINYTATMTYIRSGVQSRQDEKDSFLGDLFANATDTPGMVQAKQATRLAFEVANSKDPQEAGKLIGQGVAAQRILPSVLKYVTNDDQAFVQGVLEGSGGAVMFDDKTGEFKLIGRR